MFWLVLLASTSGLLLIFGNPLGILGLLLAFAHWRKRRNREAASEPAIASGKEKRKNSSQRPEQPAHEKPRGLVWKTVAGVVVFLAALTAIGQGGRSASQQASATEHESTRIAGITATMIRQTYVAGLPTATPSLTPTITLTPSPAPTSTPLPSAAPDTPIPSVAAVQQNASTSFDRPQTYHVISAGNLRECARLDCTVIIQYGTNEIIEVIGSVHGEAASDNTLWYIIQRRNGTPAYIHSSVVQAGHPQPVIAPQVVQQQGQPPASDGIMWNCHGNIYNCDSPEIATYSLLMSYFLACPGDPSDLDRNKDGIPCENR